MILDQYFLGCLAHASYLVGDEDSKTAVVIDPQRDVDQYTADAMRYGLEIRYVFLTHFHADFLAGHLELMERTGAVICLGPNSKADYDFRQVADGESVVFGDVSLQVLATPGHTPDSISILLYDRKKDERTPYALFSGDTLFIGDVGRPDHLVDLLGMTAEELGGLLYDSLHQKILTLPDETLLYPAHGAGSLCGKNLSEDTVSTLGVQRHYNYALQPMEREAFVNIVTADQPDAPAYFAYDAVLNSKKRQTLDKALKQTLKPLSLDAVLELRSAGAQLLDVREPADFEGAHIRGSINIGLDGKYATWVGTILEGDRPIVVIADPGREEEAAMRLGRIGFDNVGGYLDGGMQALAARDELIQRTERITAATLAEQLEAADPPRVLDVRTEREWGERRIAGSINIPLNRLVERISEVPADRTLVIHCESGYRASVAASIIEAMGDIENSADLVGGLAAWEAAQLPIVSDQSAPK